MGPEAKARWAAGLSVSDVNLRDAWREKHPRRQLRLKVEWRSAACSVERGAGQSRSSWAGSSGVQVTIPGLTCPLLWRKVATFRRWSTFGNRTALCGGAPRGPVPVHPLAGWGVGCSNREAWGKFWRLLWAARFPSWKRGLGTIIICFQCPTNSDLVVIRCFCCCCLFVSWEI